MSSRRSNRQSSVVESFEPRRHLTAATVTGSSGADEIRVSASFSTIVVEVNGLPTSYPTVIYNSVQIDALGNSDTIYIDASDGIPITVNSGSGDDQIHFAQQGGDLTAVAATVTLQNSAGSDAMVLHDENASGANYNVTATSVSRGGFSAAIPATISTVRLLAGSGNDNFTVKNGTFTGLIIDGGAGTDVLNLGQPGGGASKVSFETSQDFALVNSEPGSTLSLLSDSGLLLTTNQSNFEGNTTLGTGYIVERNSQVAGGLGYWRERLKNGVTAASPSLVSTFAQASAANDAIGYVYAQDVAFDSINGVDLESGDLVLRYTLKGDANLDKTVGFDDLVSLAQNYNASGFREWRQGDFDISRSVTFEDLVSLAQSYNSTASLTTPFIAAAPSTKKATAPRFVAEL